MKNESGYDSGWRGFGRLAMALIPWALGIGAAVWFGFYLGVREFRRALSQEERAAVHTGAVERPRGKIVAQIVPHDCSRLTDVDIDGSTLTLYAKNDCHEKLDYFSWHWQAVSPNGTVIKDGWTNQCPTPIRHGDAAECRMNIGTDDRTKTLRAWTQRSTR